MSGGPRYARRQDENHAEIKAVFEADPALSVTDSSGWGDGAGDLFLSVGAYCCFVEIKRDRLARLTKAQIEFRKKHDAVHFRIETVEDARNLCAYVKRVAAKFGPMKVTHP